MKRLLFLLTILFAVAVRAHDDFCDSLEVDGLRYLYVERKDFMAVMGYTGVLPKDLVIPAQLSYHFPNSKFEWDVPVLRIYASFDGCKDLETVTVPGSLAVVNDSTFLGCPKLREFKLGERSNLESAKGISAYIEEGALCRLNHLYKYPPARSGNAHFTSSFRNVSAYAFAESAIESAVFDSVGYFDKDAFRDCKNLTMVKVDRMGFYLSERVFANCTKLSRVELPPILFIRERAFLNCAALKSVELFPGLKEIGDHAFEGSGLEEVKIPDGTNIREGAFWGCKSLCHVTLPAQQGCIETKAFGNCPQKLDVTNLAREPLKITDDVFCNPGVLHVLPGCKTAYEAAEVWNRFTIVEDAEATGIESLRQGEFSNSIYDLHGRRVKTASHGIVVKDGKKILQ